jgi:hypothetical protein
MDTPQSPACEADIDEGIDCWNCEDSGFYVTVGGIRQPCPECKTGDMFFYHEPEDDGSHEVTEEAHEWHDRLILGE